MKRSKKIILLSHCILNSNSKVEGLSQYEGVFKEIVDMIHNRGIGIIQLPCPEMIMYGIKRWGHVKEQFDTVFFRQNCKDIINPIVGQVKSYLDSGYDVVGVIGIDGSPSCGVNFTCSGEYSGEIHSNDINSITKNISQLNSPGVFMEELDKCMQKYNIKLEFGAIDENDVFSSLENVKYFLESTIK